MLQDTLQLGGVPLQLVEQLQGYPGPVNVVHHRSSANPPMDTDLSISGSTRGCGRLHSFADAESDTRSSGAKLPKGPAMSVRLPPLLLAATSMEPPRCGQTLAVGQGSSAPRPSSVPSVITPAELNVRRPLSSTPITLDVKLTLREIEFTDPIRMRM